VPPPPTRLQSQFAAYREALRVGNTIDLSSCVYGPEHWGNGFKDRPSSHYPFLAGLVHTQGLTRVLEIGTHYGGSISAMYQGFASRSDEAVQKAATVARFVTVDITNLNRDGLSPAIIRITGDALDPSVITNVSSRFPLGRSDLLFVDAGHDYAQTWETIALYFNRLDPRYIAVDDIRLNVSMRKLWEALCQEFEDNATDVSDLIGRANGFGIISTEAFRALPADKPVPYLSFRVLPEMPAAQRAIARRYWHFRHSVADRLPVGIRHHLRELLRGGR
jgi:hypothetical protein